MPATAPAPGHLPSIAGILAERARRDPSRLALAGREGGMTYGELLDAVSRVAGHIASRVPPGGLVATRMHHGPRSFAALLGCHLAGCVVVPLGRAERDRQTAILAAARPAAVLTDMPDASALPEIALDDAWAAPPAALTAGMALDAPAFVGFTSGSSGIPKGVVGSARSVLARAADGVASLDIGPDDVVLTPTMPGLGSGLAPAIGALMAGAAALVIDLAEAGAGAVARLAQAHRPTVLNSHPTVAHMLLSLAPEAFSGLRVVRVGAAGLAAAGLANLRGLLPAGCAINHTYASTEAMMLAQWTIPPDYVPDGPSYPVGRPTAGIVWHLEGEDGARLPARPGALGELVVCRPDMAIGEWVEGRLVAGRLRADPERPGWRMFHTGDLIRLRCDGLWDFAGRVDRQIKVNGVRIEPGEIEAVLERVAGAGEAIALAAGPGEDRRLEAFVAGPAELHPRLLAQVRASLPRSLWPARITMLAAMPRLPSGKVDVQALLRMWAG